MRVSPLACLLFPLRFVVMSVVEAAVVLVCLGCAVPPRAFLAACARAIIWCVGFGVGNVRVVVEGDDDPAEPPPMIIVSNHASVIDGFVLSAVLNAPSFLAKASLRDLPIYGTILKGIGVEFVERSSPQSRADAVAALVRRATDRSRPPIVVFPEGTTNSGALPFRPFRAGAFRAGVPVRPVAIDYGPDAWRWMVGEEAKATGPAKGWSVSVSAASSAAGGAAGGALSARGDSEAGGDGAGNDLLVILRLALVAPFHTVTVRLLPALGPGATSASATAPTKLRTGASTKVLTEADAADQSKHFADAARAAVESALRRGREAR